MNTKQQGKLNEKRVLEEIKKASVVKGYYVICIADIARKLHKNHCVVRGAIERLERKNLIQTKRSVALFGSMFKLGIKICPSECEKGGKFQRKQKININILKSKKGA